MTVCISIHAFTPSITCCCPCPSFYPPLSEGEQIIFPAFSSVLWRLSSYRFIIFRHQIRLTVYAQGHTNTSAHSQQKVIKRKLQLPSPPPMIKAFSLHVPTSYYLHKHSLVSFIPKAFHKSLWKLHIEQLPW